jgi:hypothetical protein
VIARDARRYATIRAERLTQPLQVNGRLSEAIYDLVPAAGEFVQQVPDEGKPASEATEVWVFFDDRNLYIAARCSDSHPERDTGAERRRDHVNATRAGDNLTVVLDTFYDRRNAFFFQTNPSSIVREQLVVDTQQNESWDTVWDVKSVRTPTGWTTEMVIPFKSLRYRRAGPQIWGINFRRVVAWKNEVSTLNPLPASFAMAGISQMGYAATLVGVETPARSLNLELKPYAVSSVTTDLRSATPFRNDLSSDVGFDFKYGLTRGLIVDATVNTDFAQVEEDVQQINLTRFNLLFPEKRDFFLEGQGTFAFGGRSLQGGGDDVPILFFSRQIGLSNGQAVPVVGGGRLTGRTGAFDIGALNIQTAAKAPARAVATNFSVLRVKRNIFRQSYVGIIATNRAPSEGNSNQAAGVDANLRFFRDVFVNAYYARTSTPGRSGDESSYRGRFEYGGDRYGLTVDHVLVGDGFNPEVGFLRRGDFRRNLASARFSPRPRNSRVVRRWIWEGGGSRITSVSGGDVENREGDVSAGAELHSGDQLSLEFSHQYEFVPEDFTINAANAVQVPRGSYTSDGLRFAYTLGLQRRISGTIAASHGSFYRGDKTEASYSGRLGFSPALVVEPGITLNWVSLPFGDFTSRLFTVRTIITPTARMSVSGLVQANAGTKTLSSSARWRWEYVPGSELFLVYSDGRDTGAQGFPALVNRSVAFKLTRLLRR